MRNKRRAWNKWGVRNGSVIYKEIVQRRKSMDSKLYEVMNWPRIEAVVYSEEDNPAEILGPHVVEKLC